MTNTTTDQRDRRILSFPAVHPCDGITPATLLASLITLSQTICNFQPQLFTTQRRNARETTRQITIILIFLQEIQERQESFIPDDDSFVLSFSELHFTLQKIHFLLQDCSLRTARLLILHKSHTVAAHFQTLIRAVATVLDVLLPLNRFEICDEVKEVVELVAKQARKAKFDVDPNDESARRKVHSILQQFERGTEPDKSAIQEILDYLGIKKWFDCDNEIKFLEQEIVRCESSDIHEREVQLLSSLVGFLSYCRGVIFETLELEPLNTDNQSGRCSTEMVTLNYCVNPEDFRCPISLEWMTDPVTVSTGQTYDRSSIQKWLKAGNTKCPKTGESLKKTELLPNVTLKRLIQNFCSGTGISFANSSNRIRDITKTAAAGSPAAAHAVQFLSWFLTNRLMFGNAEQKNKAAYEIRVLARSSIFNRACLVEVGAVPPLLDLLKTEDDIDKSTQENAISALLKLAKHATGPERIMENGGLNAILSVLKKGVTLEARQIAAATIFYLSSVKEYRKLIGENPNAIPALVELIRDGTTCGKKNAVVAIFGLLLLPRNHQRVIDAGAVPVLVDVLASSDKDELVTETLAVLAALAENAEGAHAVLQAEALPVIIAMLRSATTSGAGKEHSASVLLSLCVNVEAEVVAVLAEDRTVLPLLYSLLTDGTSHAAKKARLLIKVLQDFKEKTNSGLKGYSVPRE